MSPEEFEAEAELAAASLETYDALAAWASRWRADGGSRDDFIAAMQRDFDAHPWSSEETRRAVVGRSWIRLGMVWPEGEA